MKYRANELERLTINLYYAILSNTNEEGQINLSDLDNELEDLKNYLDERNKL